MDDVLGQVFKILDDNSLTVCEVVCSNWRNIIIQEKIYAKKCTYLRNRHPGLIPTFARQKFDSLIKHDHKASKEFYFKLKFLKLRWQSHVTPKIYSYHCVSEAVSKDWLEKHNYTGVYDMVYLSDRSLLICSVYDSIQVWDMSKNERVNLFRGHLLDSKLERTNCFHAFGNALITGTNTGKIHAFDLLSSQHLGESQRCYGIDMICDIKSYGKTLLAIDWRGLIAEWRWQYTKDDDGREIIKFALKRSFYPPFPDNEDTIAPKYKSRYSERLIDYNDNVAATNISDMFCIFDIQRLSVSRWILTKKTVLCSQVFQQDVYWAGSEGMLFHFRAPSSSSSSSSSKLEDKTVKNVEVLKIEDIKDSFQTKYQDSITSIAVSDDKILMGDVNAEIHCLSRTLPLTNESLRFTLETGHAYKSFIWALEIDDSRIISGDSDASLVVHDFWDYSDSPTCHEPKKTKYSSDSPICHETK